MSNTNNSTTTDSSNSSSSTTGAISSDAADTDTTNTTVVKSPHTCIDCGCVITGRGSKALRCAACNKKFRTFTCIVCNNEYYYDGKYITAAKVCPTCIPILPGEGNSVRICHTCNSPFRCDSRGSYKYCPSCILDKNTLICAVCYKDYIYTGGNGIGYMKKSGIIKVCPECQKTLPGEGGCVFECVDCHCFYLANSSFTTRCPDCALAHKTFTCEICGSHYTFDNLKHLGRYMNSGVRVCDDCVKNRRIPGDGGNVLRCIDCGCAFLGNNSRILRCPDCKLAHKTFTCEVCGCSYVYTGRGCHLPNYIDNSCKVCPNCKKTLPGKGPYTKTCYGCGNPFRATGISTSFCPACIEVRNSKEVIKEYTALLDTGWTTAHVGDNDVIIEDIPELERIPRTSRQKIITCPICNRNFIRRSSKQVSCGHCYIVRKCITCGVKFALMKSFYDNKCCSFKCNVIDLHKHGYYYIVENTPRPKGSITYDPINKPVSDVDDKAGVWAVYDRDGVLLDVHSTMNIALEWRKKILHSKFDGHKYKTMSANGIDLDINTLKCIIIAYEDDPIKRLMIEEDYAITHDAQYWYPQPGTFQQQSRE